MRYPIRILILLCSVLVIVLLYNAFLFGDTSLTQLQQNGVIRVGYAVEAPYAYITAEGHVTGESPEVAKTIIESLGIERTEWIQTEFDQLIPGLLDQRFDVIAAGMFITAERAEKVQFSNPTFHVQPGLLVYMENPLQLHTYEDIANNRAAKVAALSGSVEETLLREAGVVDSQLVLVADALTGEIALRTGLVNALALSSPTVRWLAANDTSGTTVALEVTTPSGLSAGWGYGGFVFRPTDRQLLDAWNKELATYIGSPNHIKLIAQFGFTEAELPGTVTTEMILDYEK